MSDDEDDEDFVTASDAAAPQSREKRPMQPAPQLSPPLRAERPAQPPPPKRSKTRAIHDDGSSKLGALVAYRGAMLTQPEVVFLC